MRPRGPAKRYRSMTPRAASAMRELYFIGRMKQRDLGRMFGIRQCSVSRIVSGHTWN